MIARNYIAHGMRARAEDLITWELGPETEIEDARKLRRSRLSGQRDLTGPSLRSAQDFALERSAPPERDPVGWPHDGASANARVDRLDGRVQPRPLTD